MFGLVYEGLGPVVSLSQKLLGGHFFFFFGSAGTCRSNMEAPSKPFKTTNPKHDLQAHRHRPCESCVYRYCILQLVT